MGVDASSLLAQALEHRRRGEHEAALEFCRRILAARPDHSAGWFLKGALLRDLGEASDAAAAMERGLHLGLSDVRARCQYADVLIQLDRLDEAEAQLESVLEQDPDFTDALHMMGKLALQRGAFARAESMLRRGFAAEPFNAALQCNLANALLELGRIEEALSHFEAACAQDPNDLAMRFNLANGLRRAGHVEAAIAAYQQVLASDPQFVPALSASGACLAKTGDIEKALIRCQQAVDLDPDNAEARNNLGAVFHEMGRWSEAAQEYREALAIDPRNPRALDNLGQVLYALGEFDSAVECYDEALRIAPEFDVAYANRALIHLVRGDFAQGWIDNRAREAVRGATESLYRDRLPDNLSGKRILLVREQGLGDELLYLRFVGNLHARGAWVAYRPDPRLAGMCARLPDIDAVVVDEEVPDGVDLTIPLGDLPYMLGMASVGEIPPSITIPVLDERRDRIRRRLTALGPPPHIGVTWRAGSKKRGRAVPIEAMARALRSADGTVIALQRDIRHRELDEFATSLGRPVYRLADVDTDLEDLLALLDLLDEYVCVSNSNVDFRMARAKPSRVLVAHPPDLRWMASGDRSPWFPSSPLYRQEADGDWGSALARLADDLAQLRHP